ncbi:MAG: four helix bundle protein [Candidatus Moraniibacteriota bacterium]
MNKETNTKKIVKFTDLDAWKQGHKLVLFVYQLTKEFPKEEIFGLVSQMRRCAVSITSNIAEGFSRRSFKDKVHFYVMAQGSLTELQNQLLIARDIGYITQAKFSEIAELSVVDHKILSGLIKKTQSYSHDS